MGALQLRQRPRSHRYPRIGMLSYGFTGDSQCGQCEPGHMSDLRRGSLWMQTFRKLPTTVPNIVMRTADAVFIAAPALRPSTPVQLPVRSEGATIPNRAPRRFRRSPDPACTVRLMDRAAARVSRLLRPAAPTIAHAARSAL